ncbi:RNI-like protein [Rhizoclosmatium globosum]|uniref:RNI-like protein n=1 Tax=Rhizoclosmatium globosum TaxID=329046 RepID=A0A1Y2CE63_9FUNG|nr:RNI-like protein [Rhizoclosmatium globosum]|eukprot:ORY45177.1 RNI-like protein [Rhizoclosmatium globosum]
MPSLLQTTLPLETIKEIFSWIDPRYARRYRQLCQRVNLALIDPHFALLNLQRILLVPPNTSSNEDTAGVIVCSINPAELDTFFFRFPKDYRLVYIDLKLHSQTIIDWSPLAFRGPAMELCAEVGLLVKLKVLRMHFVTFVGSIPNEIGQLVLLKNLYLEDCGLEGAIPSSLGQLKRLTHLSLALPIELMSLTDLEYFRLDHNNLSGSIPESIGNLRKLVTLNWSHNSFSGLIPSSIGRLELLDGLHLHCNKLSGNLPNEVAIQSLFLLNVSRNHLEGAIPYELGNLQSLDTLNLSDNQFSGAIPNSFVNINRNLSNILLGKNNLSGVISEDMAQVFNNCFNVDLSHNRFCGQLPRRIWESFHLESLQLNDNEFDAYQIPPQIGNLTNLLHLDLSNTSACGFLPLEMCNLDLVTIKLGGTNLFKMVDAQFEECAPFWKELKEDGFYIEQMNAY